MRDVLDFKDGAMVMDDEEKARFDALCQERVPRRVPQPRYVPVDEGGGNERCENCEERASAHYCLPISLVPKSRLESALAHTVEVETERDEYRSALLKIAAQVVP